MSDLAKTLPDRNLSLTLPDRFAGISATVANSLDLILQGFDLTTFDSTAFILYGFSPSATTVLGMTLPER